MDVKLLTRTAVGCGILANLVWLVFASEARPWSQLAAAVLVASMALLLLVSIVVAAVQRAHGLRALVPAGLTLAFLAALPLSVLAGSYVRGFVFEQRKPRYLEVVSLLRKGEIPLQDRATFNLPPEYADLAYAVQLERRGDDLVVVFWTGSGFPARHRGYAFVSDRRFAGWRVANQWPHAESLDEHWVRVGD